MKKNDIKWLPAFIRRVIVLVVVGCVSISHISADMVVKQTLDWDEVHKVFDRYFNCPSSDNAIAISRVLPREIPDKVSGNQGRALEYIINSIDFRIIASEALAGERSAAEIMFRLRKFTDGWDSEVLDGTLGALLRINPMLFLEVLFEHKDDPLTKNVGYSVAFPNYAYNNHASAFIYELEKRSEALARVDDSKYDELKQECVRQIRREMNRLLAIVDGPTERPQEHDKSGQDLDWGRVLPTFERYFNYPTPENAKAVLSVIPKEQPGKVLGDTRRALASISSAETYGILALESKAGDKHSVELLIRLLGISETPESKLFKSTLGAIVRLNPRLFLDVLYDYKDAASMKTAGYSVAHLDDAYIDRPCASKHELEKRIMSLDGVTEPKYDELKQACLSELEQAIEKLKRKRS